MKILTKIYGHHQNSNIKNYDEFEKCVYVCVCVCECYRLVQSLNGISTIGTTTVQHTFILHVDSTPYLMGLCMERYTEIEWWVRVTLVSIPFRAGPNSLIYHANESHSSDVIFKISSAFQFHSN